MSDTPKNLEDFIRIAEWREQPMSPGNARAFNTWFDESNENQRTWRKWQDLFRNIKHLQIRTPDLDEKWEVLREGVGLRRVHGSKGRKRVKVKQKKETGFDAFVKRPLIIAIFAMIVLSLFFFGLYMMRVKMGFSN